MKTATRYVIFAAAAILFASTGAAQNSTGTSGGAEPPRTQFTLPDDKVDLPAGKPEGTDVLRLKITGKNLPLTPPVLNDEGIPAGPTSSLKPLKMMSGDSNEQNWLISAQVTGVASLGTETRFVTIRQGTASETLSYSVNNAYTGEFSWNVHVPAALRWRRTVAIPVSVHVTGALPASTATLREATLFDDNSLDPVRLELCREPTGDCTAPGALEPKRSHTLYLRPAGSAEVGPGNYSGTVALSAPEKADVVTAPLKLHVSSGGLKLLGVLVLALGVGIAWFVSVGARSMIARRQLQRVLSLIEERRAQLSAQLDTRYQTSSPPRTRTQLEDLRLDITRMENLLPARVPLPWQDPWGSRAKLEAAVTAADSRLDGLEVVIRTGLLPVADEDLDDPQVAEALKNIDGKADTVATAKAEAIAAEIREILSALYKALGSADDSPPRLPAPAKLAFEIALLGAASWLVILLATVLVGALVLIVPNLGFGRWDDFIGCLLWGLGIPIAGGQLNAQTPGSVRTAFKVSEPS